MKRNIPSFTVEVRRQPRRASNPSANGRLFETAPIRTAFDRDTQRAADAVFEAKAPEQPLPDSAPSAPKGRILPSLVVDDASMRSFREDLEQLDEVRARAAETAIGAVSEDGETFEVAADFGLADSRDSALGAPAEAIVVPPSEPPAASREAAGSAGAPASHKAPKRRVKKPKVPEYDRIAAWLAQPEPMIIAHSPPAAPSPVGEVSPNTRKRSIMGRYVHGDELKPGERWKRLLRKTR